MNPDYQLEDLELHQASPAGTKLDASGETDLTAKEADYVHSKCKNEGNNRH